MKKIPQWVKIVGIVILVCLISLIVIPFLIYSLWMKDSREKVGDISQYEDVLGENGRYKNNYIGYNDIFPYQIPESAEVEKFYFEYYNPWDPNYLGYLIYTCNDEDFQMEYERLQNIESSADPLIYGATGFPYELCAVYADEFFGYSYVLADIENKKFIYVDLEFNNFYTDIDYKSIIDSSYLPYGFDAASGNATRPSLMEKLKEMGGIRPKSDTSVKPET